MNKIPMLCVLALVLAACNSAPESTLLVEKLGEISPGSALTIQEAITFDNNLIDCIFKSSIEISTNIPEGLTLAVIQISSRDEDEGEFALEQLIFFLVQNGKYRIVERRDLDIIRREQNFQLSGEVDDNTAVSIGRMAGAGIVITGSILPFGSVSYLILRALDMETASILSASSRPFISVF